MGREMTSEAFEFLDGVGPRTLRLVSDRIKESLEFCAANGIDRVAIEAGDRYKLDNLEILANSDFLKGVHLTDARGIDLSALERMKQIEFLLVDHSKSELDLEWFPNLTEFRGNWHPRLRISGASKNLRLLLLRGVKSSGALKLSLPKVEELSLVQCPIHGLDFLGGFSGLSSLRISYFTKLKHICGIREHDIEHLEFLSFTTCRKLEDHHACRDLSGLRVLELNDCGTISSLEFLNDLLELEEFRFVNTDVSDGDLRPLLRLRSVGFFDKRHFSHKYEEIVALLNESDSARQ